MNICTILCIQENSVTNVTRASPSLESAISHVHFLDETSESVW